MASTITSLPIIENDTPYGISISNREVTTLSAVLSLWIDHKILWSDLPEDAQLVIYDLMSRITLDAVAATPDGRRSESSVLKLTRK
jgi:hypothetical protein